VTTHEFTAATSYSGTRHTITVKVHDTHDAMRAYLEVATPHVTWTGQSGLFHQPGYYWDNPPELMGEINLCQDFLDTHTIAHESVHAACAIYHADILGPYSRATRHLTPDNEILAYLVDDLVEQIMAWAFEAGLFDQGYAELLEAKASA
jgi:hypothetical protein